MAKFDQIIGRILAHEGGFVDHLNRALEAEARRACLHVVTPDPANNRGVECEHPGCCRVAYATGLCNAHYIRKRAGNDMDRPFRATRQGDACTECGAPKGGKGGWGLCAKHYKRKRRAVLKAAAVGLMGGKCSGCSQSFPLAAYDFHHVSGAKEANPSSMLDNASVVAIATELEKCVLLCANCHRLEHADEV